MDLNKRKQTILDLLEKNGSVSVAELSKVLGTSEVTVRTYLTDLEAKGLLSRVHGGAISSYKPYYSMNLSQRLSTNQAEKLKIAKAVAKMVDDKDTIMLNSGTTTLLVFRSLPTNYNLNIVTNSVAIALEAADIQNFNVCLLGGYVNSKYQFSYGDDAIEQLKRYHADKLILSVDGIDTQNGFTTYYDKEAAIDRTMIEQSEICIVAADATKFGRTAFAKISSPEVADIIVTDSSLNDTVYNSLTELGTDIRKVQ
ncbi:MAG: DeoR/GlpR transcriptional regulator [Ruminococcaceae bacterium]|nr:DeoR/GlpR transcriptional regulator [Oscillospiraceae bacterium]